MNGEQIAEVVVSCVVGALTLWAVSAWALRRRRRRRPARKAQPPPHRLLRAVESGAPAPAVLAAVDGPHALECVDGAGNTALMLAARRGDAALAKALLAAAPAPDFAQKMLLRANGDGYSAAHVAAIARAVDAVAALLSAGGDVDARAERNRWTCLHVAAAQGDAALAAWLLAHGADPNAADVVAHTPLILAACNGHAALVQALLRAGGDVCAKTSNTVETAVYVAARGGHADVVRMLLAAPGGADAAAQDNVAGATPLHAAAQAGSVETALALLGARCCDVDALRRDAYTPLHVACVQGCVPVAELLLAHGADPRLPTRFGTTALHEAAFGGHTALVRMLLASGRCAVDGADKDGETALHRACNARKPALETIALLLDAGASVAARDRGNGTPLHVAACCHADEAPKRVELLLARGADIDARNIHNWTPLHLAHSVERSDVVAVIEAWARKHVPGFLEHFDKTQPRDLDYAAGEVPAADAERLKALSAVFGGAAPTLEAVAEKIRSGGVRHVVVLAGAGISVSAGIPDFRGPSSREFRAERERLGISNPSAVFDLSRFVSEPRIFYEVIRQVFLPVIRGAARPTAFHYLLRLMHEKGILERVYTQNVDTLEHIAGVPAEKIVEAHGTFRRAFCTGAKCSGSAAFEGEAMREFWNAVEAGDVPLCPRCGSVLIPDVVFFGMQLPRRFSETRTADFRNCDLLLVAGTSLVVYPFASLVNEVADLVPRLLFNSDAVGPWKKLGTAAAAGGAPSPATRDVAVLGEIDAGARKLAELLGWSDDLNSLFTAPATSPAPAPAPTAEAAADEEAKESK